MRNQCRRIRLARRADSDATGWVDWPAGGPGHLLMLAPSSGNLPAASCNQGLGPPDRRRFEGGSARYKSRRAAACCDTTPKDDSTAKEAGAARARRGSSGSAGVLGARRRRGRGGSKAMGTQRGKADGIRSGRRPAAITRRMRRVRRNRIIRAAQPYRSFLGSASQARGCCFG